MVVYASLNGNTNNSFWNCSTWGEVHNSYWYLHRDCWQSWNPSCYTELYTGFYFLWWLTIVVIYFNTHLLIYSCTSICLYHYTFIKCIWLLMIYPCFLDICKFDFKSYQILYLTFQLIHLYDIAFLPDLNMYMHTFALLCTIIAPCYDILFLIRTQGPINYPWFLALFTYTECVIHLVSVITETLCTCMLHSVLFVSDISRVYCQKGPTHHAYAWQIGPFWQNTLNMYKSLKNLNLK